MFILCLFLWNFCLKKHYFSPWKFRVQTRGALEVAGPNPLDRSLPFRCFKVQWHWRCSLYLGVQKSTSRRLACGHGAWLVDHSHSYGVMGNDSPEIDVTKLQFVEITPNTILSDLGLLQSIPNCHFIAGFIMDYHLRSLEMRWFELRQGKSPKDRERQQEPHHNWVFRRKLICRLRHCDSHPVVIFLHFWNAGQLLHRICKSQETQTHWELLEIPGSWDLEPWRPIPGLCFLNSQPSAEN